MMAPQIIASALRAWFRFGIIAGKISSPFVLAILYAVMVLPTALIFRLARRDVLQLGAFKAGRSTWAQRQNENDINMSFKDQF